MLDSATPFPYTPELTRASVIPEEERMPARLLLFYTNGRDPIPRKYAQIPQDEGTGCLVQYNTPLHRTTVFLPLSQDVTKVNHGGID